MGRPRVAVGTLGGTIAMSSDTRTHVTPRLSAHELVAAVPGLESIASVEPKTLSNLPSASLTCDELLGALRWARQMVDAGASGVVLVQGTDTLEESAFLLDLYWDRTNPLVLTGAMRPPQRAGSDGPANLLASIATAADPVSEELGVLVVMNDEIHAAARVSKQDAMSVNAFRSPAFGPLGRLVEDRPTYATRQERRRLLPIPEPTERPDPRVALLATHLGDGGELLDLVVDHGYDAVVLAAFGAGHVSAATAEAVSRATERMPVVFASRTGAGTTAQSMYGFPGSETDLVRRGAIAAGWLPPVKARLLLWALIRSGSSREQLRSEFGVRGALS
jgi:L-asparaginase